MPARDECADVPIDHGHSSAQRQCFSLAWRGMQGGATRTVKADGEVGAEHARRKRVQECRFDP